MAAGEVGCDLSCHRLLPAGQGERQPLVEGRQQSGLRRDSSGRRQRSGLGAPPGQHDLEQERLVEAQPLLSPAYVLAGLRPVHQAQRVPQREKSLSLADRVRERVGDVVDQAEDRGDTLGDGPRGELRRGRVDRQETAREGVGVLPDVDLGVGQRQLPVEDLDLAGEEGLGAGRQRLLKEPLVEERQDELCAAVGDDDV